MSRLGWKQYPGSREPRTTSESHHTTNLTPEIYWEGETQEGGCLCLAEKQQRTEQKTGFT